jgi:Transglycosylase-like domain
LKRLTLAASLALVVFIPATAVAKEPTARHRGVYEYLYRHTAQKLGPRAPGRNIVRDGLPRRSASDADVVRSIGVLERTLMPAAPVSTTSPTAAGASVAPSSSPLPTCTWQPESGGDPSAVNPSSGAGGYYQIMPSTWAAYGGTGAPQNAPMSEQTAIAQKIYDSAGLSAWANC